MKLERFRSFRQSQLDLMKVRREGHDSINVL